MCLDWLELLLFTELLLPSELSFSPTASPIALQNHSFWSPEATLSTNMTCKDPASFVDLRKKLRTGTMVPNRLPLFTPPQSTLLQAAGPFHIHPNTRQWRETLGGSDILAISPKNLADLFGSSHKLVLLPLSSLLNAAGLLPGQSRPLVVLGDSSKSNDPLGFFVWLLGRKMIPACKLNLLALHQTVLHDSLKFVPR